MPTMNAVANLRPPGGKPASASDRMLLDTARRLARQPSGWTVLVVHIGRMINPKPHHRRVARAILQDVAQRLEGQVFAPRNGDLVLICRETPPGLRLVQNGLEPQQLTATLGRLLQAETPPSARLISAWRVNADPTRLLAYATARLEETVPPPGEEPDQTGQTARVKVLSHLAAGPDTLEVMHRQTAALLLATRPKSDAAIDGGALRPLFTELDFSIAAIEARAPVGGQEPADPYLLRYLANRLDRGVIELVADGIGRGSPLDVLQQRQGVAPLHLNLGLATILSDEFACLTAALQAAGASLGVEIAASEACADPVAFRRARTILAQVDATLVLDGLSHLSLLFSQPWLLGADLLKLDWSPRMADLEARDRADLDVIAGRIGKHRLVLHRADTEAALRWGLAIGIRRFQGRHVDAMFAAARIMACPKADLCTLRQCSERASAVSQGGRAFCRNLRLLDAAAP